MAIVDSTLKTPTLTIALALAGCATCARHPVACSAAGVIGLGVAAYAVERHGLGYVSPRPRTTIGTPSCSQGSCQ